MLFATNGNAFAEDWKQFHGPGSNRLIAHVSIPEKWDDISQAKWKVTVLGEGR